MKAKAVVIDFDGTITTEDMSDLLAKTVGKQVESMELNRQFWEGSLTGLSGLVQRINFLKGITKQDLEELVEKSDYLRDGAYELFDYLRSNGIISIIASGSVLPLLEMEPYVIENVWAEVEVSEFKIGPSFQ
jgi:phosphoserine phosphatase